ncbi:MAG: hypothetical protein ABIR56_00695 [Polaromonas sp.]
MRIIGFSNAAASPFWITPVQALVPWLSRIRDSLGDSFGHLANLPPAQQEVQREVKPVRREADGTPAFTPGTAASNDPVFAVLPQADRRPCTTTPQALHSHALRVVRESDAALKADCAGRMVMSGKIADICAELDRMALRAARAEG